MNIYNFPPLIAALANLFLFVFLLIWKRKKTIHICFSLFCLSLAIWNIGAFLSFTAPTFQRAFWAVKINSIGLVLIPTTFFLFVRALIDKKTSLLLYLFFYSVSLMFLVISLNTNLFFSDIVYRFWGYYPVSGPANAIFAFFMITIVIYSYVLLFSALKKSKGVRRHQLSWVLAGSLLGFGGGFINLFPVFGIALYPIGNVTNIFYTIIIAYAILKHRLMDIEVVIKKSILYSVLVMVIMGSYVLSTLLFGQFLHELTRNSSLIIIFLTAIVIMLGYKPVESLLENATDRVFFKRKYNYRKALRGLSGELRTVIDLEQLLNLIVVNIAKILKINRVSVMIREDGFWSGIKFEYGAKKDKLSEIRLKLGNFFNERLLKSELVLRDESDNKEVIAELDRLRASLCIPLISKKNVVGIVNLGEKLSDEHYSNEDLELLSTFTNQITVALENAKLVRREKEMISKFQQTEKLASLGRFASGLVHEIKNPLVSVKAFFQIFSDKDESEEDKRELAQLAVQEIVRIEGLLDNLLNFAKPSSPEFSSEDLYDILTEVVQLIKPEISAKKITLISEKEQEDLPRTTVDRKQMKQVFLNFIYNSMEAMPSGGELRVRVSYKPKAEMLFVEFKDNGCGIERGDLGKLFDPFYTTKPDGTGLGLAVSYNIIRNHGGDVAVMSEPGDGSSFRISLPVRI